MFPAQNAISTRTYAQTRAKEQIYLELRSAFIWEWE